MDNHPKISAILITREETYPEIIMERLDLEDGFFDEILVFPSSGAVYNRYLMSWAAKNDIIYVQDDDCLTNYQHLFKHFNGQITNGLPKPFKEKYESSGCTLVGWGCFFTKKHLEVLDKYIAKYGVTDPHLLREADRIFTYLNQPFNTVIMPHEDLYQSPDRMGYQEDHYTSMAEALEKTRLLV